MPEQEYTVRVYGILVNEQKEVLLSREKIGDFAFLKFPGGGLDAGEGIAEALVREFGEETGLTITGKELLYVSDFYAESKFLPGKAVIAVYYIVKIRRDAIGDFHPKEKDFSREHSMELQWMKVNDVKPEDFTFESDRSAWQAFLKKGN
jgi:mutator protein MutT